MLLDLDVPFARVVEKADPFVLIATSLVFGRDRP
jgi:hypothetical protein